MPLRGKMPKMILPWSGSRAGVVSHRAKGSVRGYKGGHRGGVPKLGSGVRGVTTRGGLFKSGKMSWNDFPVPWRKRR